MSQNVELEKQIVDLERERLRAMIDADAVALDTILSDDLTYIHTSTREDSKKSLIKSLESGSLSYESIDTEGVKVRIYGDAAVVTGSAAIKVSSGGRLLEFSILFTDVYAQREGRWRMVAWQSTRKPEG
jgi:hypothetical protein